VRLTSCTLAHTLIVVEPLSMLLLPALDVPGWGQFWGVGYRGGWRGGTNSF
jgi:hypothetical protein